MTTVNLIVWIIVYSFCLVHITLFTVIYIKHKNKIELLYLFVLINIFLLAVIITLSLALRYNNFITVMINIILSLYITIPIWGYFLFNVEKKFYIIIPVLVIIEAVIENIMLAYNVLNVLYISRIAFYCILTVPIFIRKEKSSKLPLNIQSDVPEIRKMQSVTKITVILFIVFMILFIPLSSSIFEISYAASFFWAVFTLSYQVPGIVYSLKRISQKSEKAGVPVSSPEKNELFAGAQMSVLSKRENEVAQAICNGDKYEEIAEKLFISLSAVKKHAYSIYRKLGINNNRELMHLFMEFQKETESVSNEGAP